MGPHLTLTHSKAGKLWKDCKFPSMLTFILLSSCLTAERSQVDEVNSRMSVEPPHPASANVEVARERHFSRAKGTESAQFGSTALVDIGDETMNLHEKMMQELSLANENKERCLFATMQPGCPSCAALGYAVSSGALSRAMGRLRIIRIDLNEFEAEARELNLPIDRVPGLIRLNDFGQIEDFLDAGEWNTNDPAEFVPIVSKFLGGKLVHQSSASKKAPDSWAIDL